MFVPSTESLDLTPKGLFPNKEDAPQNPKCIIIAEVIQQLTQKADMSAVKQAHLQNHAEERYKYLSEQNRLSLPNADHSAYLLYQKGVTAEIAQKYYSFRLSEADSKRWNIVVCGSN